MAPPGLHPSGLHRLPQPRILLEGTHLTRKTDLAFELAEHPRVIGIRRRRWHIPLISAEWETRLGGEPTKENPGRSMIDYLADEEGWAFQCYDAYLRLVELHRDYYWVIDRFHLSTMAHQRLSFGRRVDLRWVDGRLARAGFVLIHCWRHPESFVEARTHRLTYSENAHRYDDLGAFVREQEVMSELVAASSMPWLRVDVSDSDVARAATEVLDWMEETGTFWWRR